MKVSSANPKTPPPPPAGPCSRETRGNATLLGLRLGGFPWFEVPKPTSNKTGRAQPIGHNKKAKDVVSEEDLHSFEEGRCLGPELEIVFMIVLK